LFPILPHLTHLPLVQVLTRLLPLLFSHSPSSSSSSGPAVLLPTSLSSLPSTPKSKWSNYFDFIYSKRPVSSFTRLPTPPESLFVSPYATPEKPPLNFRHVPLSPGSPSDSLDSVSFLSTAVHSPSSSSLSSPSCSPSFGSLEAVSSLPPSSLSSSSSSVSSSSSPLSDDLPLVSSPSSPSPSSSSSSFSSPDDLPAASSPFFVSSSS